MDTSFEDLIMGVYNKSIEPSVPRSPSTVDYTAHLRQVPGAIMRLARKETNFQEVDSGPHLFWKAGSIYAMSKSVCQLDSYEMSIKLQALINNGSPVQTTQVIYALIPDLFELSLHKYGNFVVQAAIAKSTPTQFASIFNSFCGLFGELGRDHCGNWVIHSLMEKCSPTQREMIHKELGVWFRSGGKLTQKLWPMLDRKEIQKWH